MTSTATSNPDTDDFKARIADALKRERAGDLAQALEMYQHVIDRSASVARAHIGKAGIIQRLDGPETAIDLWRDAVQRFPNNSAGALGLAGCLEQLGQTAAARAEYEKVTNRWPDIAQATVALCRLADRHDAPETVVDRWQAASERFPDTLAVALGRAGGLARMGRRTEAIQAFDDIASRWPNDPRALVAAAQLADEAGSNDAGADARWETIASIFKESRKIQLDVALRWLEVGNPHRAASIASPITQGDDALADRAQMIHTDAMINQGNNVEAASLLKSLFDAKPGSRLIVRHLIKALRHLDRNDEASEIWDRFIKSSSDRIGNRTLVAALDDRSDVPVANAGRIEAQWIAWQFADQSKWTWDAWRDAAAWGDRAANLLLECVSRRADLLDELDGMCVAPDLSELDEAMARGKGCILASTHHGPNIAGARFLDRSRYDFYIVSGVRGLDRVNTPRGDSGSLFPATNGPATLRRVLAALRSGSLLAMTPDPSIQGGVQAVPFLGGQIEVQTLIPTLGLKYGIPSFWFQARWDDGNIVFDLVRMPEPGAGESQDEFVQQWIDVYVRQLAALVRGTPENLRFDVRWWRNLRTTYNS